jgi:serine/threonine protein kinase
MSPKVDVWSFGMTLYFVITGIGPYDYLNQGPKRKLEKNVFYNEIYNNKRTPKIPENIEIEHPQLTKLIRETWKTDPAARPTSKMIRIRLTEIYNNMV